MPKTRRKFDQEAAIKALAAKGHDEGQLRAECAAQQLSLGACAARRTLRRKLEAATASELANSKRLSRIANNAVNVFKRAHWAGAIPPSDQEALLELVKTRWFEFLASPSASEVAPPEGAEDDQPTPAEGEPAAPAASPEAETPQDSAAGAADAEDF